MADEINVNSSEVRQAVDAALKQQSKKKKKKRLIIVGVIAAFVVIIGIAAGSSSGSPDSKTTQSDGNGEAVAAEKQEPVDGKIGDFICKVKSAEICRNWEDKESVKITYEFTNNSNEAQSFDIALSDELYQNGIGLESSFTDDNDDEDFICDVKIQPGTTKEVYKVYILRDTSTPIDVEISEFISFNDDKLHYTVNLE